MTSLSHLQSAFTNNKVLVTGGCGFIGSHLVETLTAQGALVTVVDNLQAGHKENLPLSGTNIDFVESDVRDAATIEQIVTRVQPRYVFHLAANASVPGSVEDPVYDFQANCDGTFILLNALRLTGGCEKVVVASSGAVYGEPASFPIREADPLKPISPYGASKLNAEVSSRMFAQVYGLPVAIARLFNAYGPRMARFVLLDFLRKLQKNPKALEILGTGQQVRDFTYVADTVQALMLLALHGGEAEAYNVSSGTSYSVTELAHKLIAALGLTGQTEITYTGNSWVGDAQKWEVSIEKMCQLGYQPAVTLDEGLQRTIEWFQSKHVDN